MTNVSHLTGEDYEAAMKMKKELKQTYDKEVNICSTNGLLAIHGGGGGGVLSGILYKMEIVDHTHIVDPISYNSQVQTIAKFIQNYFKIDLCEKKPNSCDELVDLREGFRR
ncbi:hypothetical protein LXL04_009380 [Taraxacum kok-saghyz]